MSFKGGYWPSHGFNNATFIFPGKNKVTKLLMEGTKVFLKHIPSKGMDGLKAISVNKDLIKTSTMFY